MNVNLLRRIQKVIDKKPGNFMMGRFFGETLQPECGTAYCIAGWACVLSGVDVQEIGYYGVEAKARELLDLDAEQGRLLFMRMLWPCKFKVLDEGSEELAGAAILRIDHFIATEGRE